MTKRRRHPIMALVLAVTLAASSCGSGNPSLAAPGSWSAAAQMRAAREGGGAGLGTITAELADGTVLFAGGYRTRSSKFDLAGENFLKTSEIYDPKSNSWKGAASMHITRFGAAVLTLPKTGQVLAAGGSSGSDQVVSPSAEVFDPGTDAWTFVAPMSTCRVSATASLLGSGDVLLTGGAGCEGAAQSSAEIFRSATGDWKSVAPMHEPRWGHNATTLADGRILVSGGRTSAVGADAEQVLASTEIYDPAADTWTSAPPMHVPRVLHVGALLKSGQVIVTGGHSQDPSDRHSATTTTELYSPLRNTWTETGDMNVPREEGGSMLLPDGTLLMAGGGQQGSAEIYDPAAGTWTLTPPMTTVHDDAQMTMLSTGEVLIAGGFQMSPGHYRNTRLTERFRPVKR